MAIPILDGGQILMNIAESVKGSAFSLRTRENILRVGLLAVGLLFVTVMFEMTDATTLWSSVIDLHLAIMSSTDRPES